jgi:hypothetical protein
MINANDCVPAGGSFQARAGEMFLPTHEYFAGIDCPLANASLVNLKDMSASVVGSNDSGEALLASAGLALEDAQAERKRVNRTK